MNYIYTALFGDYDELQDVTQLSKVLGNNFKFILYTNKIYNNNYINGWEVVIVNNSNESDSIKNRELKFTFPTQDFTAKALYIDSNIKIKSLEFVNLFDILDKQKYILFSHPRNHHLIHEVSYCKSIGKINLSQYINVLKYYKNNNVNISVPISENSCFLWKFSPKKLSVSQKLLVVLKSIAPRDQLFFSHFLLLEKIDFDMRDDFSNYFTKENHKNISKKNLKTRLLFYINNSFIDTYIKFKYNLFLFLSKLFLSKFFIFI